MILFRRIRKGELIAEKHMSFYGQQWLLPALQFEKKSVVIQETVVVPLTCNLSATDLQAAVRAAIADTVSIAVKINLKRSCSGLKHLGISDYLRDGK